MGKVEVNKQKKQASLLQAAFELFTKKGFAKTMKNIYYAYGVNVN